MRKEQILKFLTQRNKTKCSYCVTYSNTPKMYGINCTRFDSHVNTYLFQLRIFEGQILIAVLLSTFFKRSISVENLIIMTEAFLLLYDSH